MLYRGEHGGDGCGRCFSRSIQVPDQSSTCVLIRRQPRATRNVRAYSFDCKHTCKQSEVNFLGECATREEIVLLVSQQGTPCTTFLDCVYFQSWGPHRSIAYRILPSCRCERQVPKLVITCERVFATMMTSPIKHTRRKG